MSRIKQPIEKILRQTGTYGFAHQLWTNRPDFESLCLNLGYRVLRGSSQLPIPSTRLIYAVILSKEVAWFLHSGRLSADSIRYALMRNSYDLKSFESILDFGCGCGRVLRHLSELKGHRLYGTDTNPELIAWDRRNLDKIASFEVNGLEPPLNYPGGRFDFVYAISVFTHFTEALQYAWIDEMRRILKPGGLLLITVHGASRLCQLTWAEQKDFRSGSLVVRNVTCPGSNLCGAYHPESYVRSHLARDLEVIDFVPMGLRDADQDIYLFRKPPVQNGRA